MPKINECIAHVCVGQTVDKRRRKSLIFLNEWGKQVYKIINNGDQSGFTRDAIFDFILRPGRLMNAIHW